MSDDAVSLYTARRAENAADLARILTLRGRVFRQGRGSDRDRFDDLCQHLMIECSDSGALVGSLRMLALPEAQRIPESYAGQSYDLTRLTRYPGPALELGRFCTDPARSAPVVLRRAALAIGAAVEESGAQLLFGCSSFRGVDPAPYGAAFALLNTLHLAPEVWAPEQKAPECLRLRDLAQRPDVQRAREQMPPLLRTYLGLGGWVSDHAVVDRDLETLHVFTAVEIPAIPAGRARVLGAMTA